MISLLATTESVLTWRTYLIDINQIAQIIGTIMVVLYVIYTYKTFLQIKKQTDYQQDAYLKVESSIEKDLTSNDKSFSTLDYRLFPSNRSLLTKYLKKDIPSNMIDVLKPIYNFEDNLFEGNYFTVNLTNYGNAEVNLIKFYVSVTILNSKEVAEKKMLKEKDTHNFEIDIPEIIGRNGGRIKIPIISTAAFPSYSITIKGEYYDIRNKKYLIQETTTAGQNEHFQKLP